MRRNLAAFLVLAQAAACAGILGLEPGVARDDPDGAVAPDAPVLADRTGLPDPTVTYHPLSDATRWSWFPVGAVGSPGAQWGAAFDGRYLYFAPYNSGQSTHLVRHDTTSPFTELRSWEMQVLNDYNGYAGGFLGAVRGGDRVFFVPYYRDFGNGVVEYNAWVAAHRPGQLDGGPNSWEFFDMKTLPGGKRGYCGGAFDGRYLYLAPSTVGDGPHGVVAQYDTEGPFTKGTSWQTFNMQTVASALRGYCGMIFDGRFLYLSPADIGSAHGEVVRYDTKASFITKTSWSLFDLTSLNANAQNFNGGAFDGRYVYFIPGRATPAEAIVARFDTKVESFDAGAAAWSLFSLSTVSPVANGFTSGAFDGRYLYLIPSDKGVITRYDTTLPFESAASWETFDLPTNVDGGDTIYRGSAFDGRYLYLVPRRGNVLRFDAREPKMLELPSFYAGSFL